MTNKPSNAEHDIDLIVEIERLAALETIAYEATRVKAAERLGMRTAALDRECARMRRTLGLETDKDRGQGRAVKIIDALPWGEPVDGDMLATALAAALKIYIVLPDAAVDAIALWVLHTWLVNEFMMSPRLAVTSPTKGCGKTTVLRFLNKVARRAKPVGSITEAALFRGVEQFQPTMLLDENEKYMEHGSPLHALLNEGHLKGATTWRVLGENMELREFAIFGAVAFARNGKVPDDLEQRSIIIEIQRRLFHEALIPLRDDRCESLQRLARMAARWSDDHRAELADVDPDMGPNINRIADNWRPLFAIADVIGSDWPERIRKAANELTPREADSHDTILLADIKAILDERAGTGGEWADRMFSEMLAEALAAIEGGRWVEYGKARKPITKNQLAQLLKKFKVVPASVRIENKTAKGYYRNQFEGVWERYLAPQGVYETSQRHKPTVAGTSTPFPNVTEKVVVTDENREKPLGHNGCDVVTFQKGENGLEGVNGQGTGTEQPGCPTADELQDAFEERAAIREFDGGETRDEAEAGATKDLLSSPDFSSAMSPEKRQ
jgi:hypothetical protein